MRIIDKYLLRNFIAPILLCLVIFIFMYIVIDLFEHLDEIIKNKVAATVVLLFYLSFIPTIFAQTMPIAVLVGTIYMLGNLNRHNEITAMRAGGMSLWRILRPLLFLGFLISLVVFLTSEKLIPQSISRAEMIKKQQIEKGRKKMKKAVLENVALYGSQDRLIFARSYNTGEKLLQDLIIHEHDREVNLVSQTTAEEARWDGQKWQGRNCIQYNLDSAGKIIGSPHFYDEKELDLDEDPWDFQRVESQTEFMSYEQLRQYVKNFSTTSTSTLRKLLVDLHHKLAFPFISWVVVFVAAPLALARHRGGALIGLGMGLAVGLSYYAIMAISLATGKAGWLPPLLSAWLANILFLGVGTTLISRFR